MPETFPKVQGGGSLILAWQIRGKNVLVVGGGEVNYILPLATNPMHLLQNALTNLWPRLLLAEF